MLTCMTAIVLTYKTAIVHTVAAAIVCCVLVSIRKHMWTGIWYADGQVNEVIITA
jgi:hypothetical protein